MGAAAARQNLSRLLTEVRREERAVIIEKGGIPVAAMVPLSVLERERRWEQERHERVALLGRMRKAFEGVSGEEIEREAVAAVAAVRREDRSRAKRR
ncbi:MAG: type II toxin-antitoxin system Phd/YefM family antitoxin [Chloroflexi bacterium]|nr:type II toxin-antitoxin system Phd/YefM family antitoxin [Chloroflexota bacterium]